MNRRALLASVCAAVASFYAPSSESKPWVRYLGPKRRVFGYVEWGAGDSGGKGGGGNAYKQAMLIEGGDMLFDSFFIPHDGLSSARARVVSIGPGRDFESIAEWLRSEQA